MQVAQNEHRWHHTLCLPTGCCFKRSENAFEMWAQILQDVVAIGAEAVARVHRRRRATDQNRPQHRQWQVAFR